MTKRLFLKAPWWPHWTLLAVSLLATAEYARLVFTTETATYRIFVLLLWAGISSFWVYRIIRERHQRQMSP